jgi:hypothetical protein
MMFGSVSEHFANLLLVKDAKLVFWAWTYYFRVQKLWSIHFTLVDQKWCSGVFRGIELTFST